MKKPARPPRPHAPRRGQRPTGEPTTPQTQASSTPLPKSSSPSRPGTSTSAQTSETPQPRAKGTWTKTPAERLAQGRQRKSNASRRPHEHPRDGQRRGGTTQNNTNVVNVGGVEISVRAIFILIMGALLLSLILPSLYQWFKQEQEYRDIVAEVENARAHNAEVQRKLDLWNNPDFIASQARERLGYVRPGETQYSVVDPGPEYRDKLEQSIAPSHGPEKPWIYNFAVLTHNADITSGLPVGAPTVTNLVPENTESDTLQSDREQRQSDSTTAEKSEEQNPGESNDTGAHAEE